MLWARSYWRSDFASYALLKFDKTIMLLRSREVVFETGRGRAVATFSNHGFWIAPGESSDNYSAGWHYESAPASDYAPSVDRSQGGFGYDAFDSTDPWEKSGSQGLSVQFPLWLPAAVLALLLVARLYRRLRHRHTPSAPHPAAALRDRRVRPSRYR